MCVEADEVMWISGGGARGHHVYTRAQHRRCAHNLPIDATKEKRNQNEKKTGNEIITEKEIIYPQESLKRS